MLKNLWNNLMRFFDDHEPNLFTVAIFGSFVLVVCWVIIFLIITIAKVFGPNLFILGIGGWVLYVIYWLITYGYLSFKPTDEA